jgi:uncharacterized protein
VAKDVVFEISEAALASARGRSDLDVRGTMTTNGYLLTPATAVRLTEVGVKHFQISLDGWAQGHDETRRRADGKGTFERVWANLLHLRHSALDVKVLLRVHLQPANRESVEKLFDELVENFGDDARFDLFCKAVGNWGGPNAGGFSVLDKQEGRERAAALQERWRTERSARTDSAASSGLPYICYAARPNSLVIRADGSVGKCTVMLSDTRNKIGTLREDGTLELMPGRLHPWLRGFRSLSDTELGCPASGLPKDKSDLLPLA